MHIFSNNLEKAILRLHLYSALVALFIFFYVYPVVIPGIESLIGCSIPTIIRLPSYLALYRFLVYLYEKSFWQITWLKHIGMPVIPNLNGEWEATIDTSYPTGPVKADVVITHTLTRFLMTLQTTQSYSKTRFAYLEVGQPISSLCYHYLSKPNNKAEDTMHMHEGFGSLELSTDCKTLNGYYYTGRDRMTCGDITIVMKK